MLLLSSLGTAAVGAILGFLLGTSFGGGSGLDQSTSAFVDGLVTGTRYRIEFEAWQADPKHAPGDPRAAPALRCAATYYPRSPMGMDGCLEGLQDKPADGYVIHGG